MNIPKVALIVMLGMTGLFSLYMNGRKGEGAVALWSASITALWIWLVVIA